MRLRFSLSILTATLILGAPAVASAKLQLLRLDGIGPLNLGMTSAAALKTGWLAHKGTGCPLGGNPPITYRLDGSKAPPGVRGSVEFVKGKLSDMTFTQGVRTAVGIIVGKSTVAQMVARYRSAGYTASSRYDSTFRGTFVTIKRNGKQVLGGFATKKKLESLSLPTTQTCE
jgi:hypothetical protein